MRILKDLKPRFLKRKWGFFDFKSNILETEMTSISKIALACAALVAASGAFAQKAGDNIVGVGLAYQP